ncbi:hypothetical protein Scep_012109 [Stephania cephalantha]|uniref:Uncharacterized protein n=1 Tax=Stephania cephalantha TaxID=152367 RepID=A0AAP0P9K0_9MAGN
MDISNYGLWGNHDAAHSTLKLYLANNQTKFETLWGVVDGLLRIQHNNINASFELSLNMVKHEFVDGLYFRLHGYISQKALKLIRDESEREEDVGDDSTLYGCDIRTTHDLPYTHEINFHKMVGSPISLEDIHVYRRKLSMVSENDVDRAGYNVNDEIQRVLKKFHACTDEDDHIRIIQEAREISRPSSTFWVVPHIKIKTKGRTPGCTAGSLMNKEKKKGSTRKLDEEYFDDKIAKWV